MAGPSADRITEWEGGSLGELVSVLQAAAMPVRIEVIAPGATGSTAGEVHLLAGGLADAFAGSLRRDDAVAALQRLEGARFIVECRLPDPESGSLSEAGPSTGSLSDRSLAALMRYCEDYVLSCRLEVWRGDERAVITYRRGEIVSTTVGGADGSERLPEVLAWTEGSYEISLPAPVLPHIPGRTRESLVARPSERKRHSTLPMMSATDGKGEASPKADGKPAPIVPVPPARTQTATPPPVRVPSRAPAVSTPSSPTGTAPVAPLQPEMTTRGTPPVPAVPLHPAPAAGRPTLQGPGSPTVAPSAPPPASKPAVATQSAQPRPPVAAPAAVKPAAPVAVPPAKPAAPAKPAVAVAPAKPAQPQPAPATPVAAPAPQAAPKPAAPAKPAQPQPAPAAQANGSARKATGTGSSNDLMPASGTIEAKPKHANNLPPSAAPIQIADQPGQDIVTTPAQPPAPSPVPAAASAPSRSVEQRRQRIASRKQARLHPVRAYIFVGLAIGIGIVLAYWAYWYLPFGHH